MSERFVCNCGCPLNSHNQMGVGDKLVVWCDICCYGHPELSTCDREQFPFRESANRQEYERAAELRHG